MTALAVIGAGVLYLRALWVAFCAVIDETPSRAIVPVISMVLGAIILVSLIGN